MMTSDCICSWLKAAARRCSRPLQYRWQLWFCRSTTYLGVHALHLILLQLKLHKVVDDAEKLGRDSLEVLVVVVLHSQRGKDCVIDQRWAQVCQHTGGMLPGVFVKVLGYEVVENCIAKKLEPLVTIWRTQARERKEEAARNRLSELMMSNEKNSSNVL